MVVKDGQLHSGETKLPWYIRGKKKGRIRWLRHLQRMEEEYLLKINPKEIREKMKAPRKNVLMTWNMAHGR